MASESKNSTGDRGSKWLGRKGKHDLDITFITERIIAMGFPASSYLSADNVHNFFETNHKDHYKFYNLCTGKHHTNDTERWHGRVEHYPIKRKDTPSFELLKAFCDNVQAWLQDSPENVVVVHCANGKERTGMLVACYLVFMGLHETAKNALDFFKAKRVQDEKGGIVPSQERFVEYFREICHGMRKEAYEAEQMQIRCSAAKSLSLKNDPLPEISTRVSSLSMSSDDGDNDLTRNTPDNSSEETSRESPVASHDDEDESDSDSDSDSSANHNRESYAISELRRSLTDVRTHPPFTFKDWVPLKRPLVMRQILIKMIPHVGIRTFSPHFKIKTCGTTYSSYHDSWSSQRLNKQDRIIYLPNLPVMDEVSIVFYHSSTKRGKLFNFVFHTSFVDKEDDDGHVTLTLGRRKIDGACKSKSFNPCFEVEVWMTADPNFMQDSVPTRQSIHPKLSRITMAFTSNRQGLHSTKAESVSREAEVTNAAIPVSDKSTGLHDSKS